MKKPEFYKNYPCGIMLISNFVSLATYLIGAFIISRIGLVWLGVYLLYILWLEIKLMKRRCINCYYYGKFCAFGRGKISAWLFKKGRDHQPTKDKITWKDVLPDFLVSVVPLIAGIALLIFQFNWLVLALMALLVVLTSVGNGFVRGSLACRFCRQRKAGCPAERLFNKNKK